MVCCQLPYWWPHVWCSRHGEKYWITEMCSRCIPPLKMRQRGLRRSTSLSCSRSVEGTWAQEGFPPWWSPWTRSTITRTSCLATLCTTLSAITGYVGSSVMKLYKKKPVSHSVIRPELAKTRDKQRLPARPSVQNEALGTKDCLCD